MNRNVKIAAELIGIAKYLIAMSPHQLRPGEVVNLQGTYHNNTDNFDAVITSTDSRKINNEARTVSRNKGIPNSDVVGILKKTGDLFAQSSFKDQRNGIRNTGSEREDKYDRKRYATTATENGNSYKITFVVLHPKPDSKQTNTRTKLHYMYIDKQ